MMEKPRFRRISSRLNAQRTAVLVRIGMILALSAALSHASEAPSIWKTVGDLEVALSESEVPDGGVLFVQLKVSQDRPAGTEARVSFQNNEFRFFPMDDPT